MGEIVKFEIGCRHCEHLTQIGKRTFCCNTRIHMDDSPVIPIKDNMKTLDWDICDGKYYERKNRWIKNKKMEGRSNE